MDQLAEDYHDKPVLFVEWGVSYRPANRLSLLQESGGGENTPEMMTDSSYRWKTGVIYESAKEYVDNALARPSRGSIEGSWSLAGRLATLNITVTNTSGIDLSSANQAAVHGIAYENLKLHKTHRVGRASTKINIENLPNGDTQTFTLSLDLSNVSSLKNLTFIGLVDYKVEGKSEGVYDQIQAAQLSPIFNIEPSNLAFDFKSNETTPIGEIMVTGSEGQTWLATSNRDWIVFTPSSGDVNTNATFTFDKAKLIQGTQFGLITIQDEAGLFEKKVNVTVKYTFSERLFFPLLQRN